MRPIHFRDPFFDTGSGEIANKNRRFQIDANNFDDKKCDTLVSLVKFDGSLLRNSKVKFLWM